VAGEDEIDERREALLAEGARLGEDFGPRRLYRGVDGTAPPPGMGMRHDAARLPSVIERSRRWQNV
jgi:hypothetical protein